MNQENPPLIDINQADEKTLTQLRGVGARMARRIIAAQPFESVDDLSRVRGISARDVERLRPFVTVSVTPAQAEIVEEAVVEDIPEELEPLETMESETEPELTTEEVSPDMFVPIPEIESEAETQEEGIELEYEVEEGQALEREELEESPEAEIAPEVESDLVSEEFEPVVEEPGEVTPTAEQPAERRPTYLTRGRAFGLFLFTFVFSVILAVAITLGILSSLNRGSLSYAAPSQVTALRTQLNSISAQTEILTEDLEGLRSRMDNLEALSGQISDVETDIDSIQSDMLSLQADVDATQAEVDELSSQMESIDEQIGTLATQNNRFENFLEGLRDLIKGLFPEAQE